MVYPLYNGIFPPEIVANRGGPHPLIDIKKFKNALSKTAKKMILI